MQYYTIVQYYHFEAFSYSFNIFSLNNFLNLLMIVHDFISAVPFALLL